MMEPQGEERAPIGLESVRMVGFVLLIAGVLLKFQRWPGADLCILTAWALTLITMVWRLIAQRPIALRILLRDLFRLALVSLLLLHFLHLPGRAVAWWVLVGCAGGALWMDRARFWPGKGESPWLFFAAVISAGAGVLFKILHWPGSTGLILIGLLLGSAWFLTSWGEQR